MIPETLGHRVVFRFDGDPDPCFVPIIAWDADGQPLVAGDKCLVLARHEALKLGVTRWWITDPEAAPTAVDPDIRAR